MLNPLFACVDCNRYVRESERLCPFCGESVHFVAPPVAAGTPIRGRSRAAAFAMRAAVLASAAPLAVGCSGDATRERDTDEGGAGSGGSSAQTANGGTGGASNAGSSNGGNGGSGGLASTDAGAANDAAEDDGGYVPVPIYGGVFPDPLSRARV